MGAAMRGRRRSRPAAAEIFINQPSKLYYDQPSMPIASHFSPFSQPSHHVPRTSGRARSLVLHAGQSYAPCWSLCRVGLRASNNRTAPHYDLIQWILAGPWALRVRDEPKAETNARRVSVVSQTSGADPSVDLMFGTGPGVWAADIKV